MRVCFQDEARFGRIQEPYRCWARDKIRPLVGKQLVREYTYAYSIASPEDGKSAFLILPRLNQNCFDIFLKEISSRYEKEYLLIFCDGASAHNLAIEGLPDNIMLHKLPSYSPELNPIENIWDDMREKWFKNKAFKSMNDVEDHLTQACLFYENTPNICKSITQFSWIVSNE